MTKLIVDLLDIEEADNESEGTTYYGGSYKVGEKVLYAHGTDRDDGYRGDLAQEIATQLDISNETLELAEEEADSTLGSVWLSGMTYELELDDDHNLTIKEGKAAEPKPPSKDEAEYWLAAMGIEVKMVDGKPSVKISDTEKVKKIFG